MFNKFNLTIKDFTAKESSSRPEIAGVFIKPNESVATDSFSLIKVSTPNVKASDYPKIPDKPEPLTNFPAFILPKEKVGEIEKLCKKNPSMPILENVVLLKRKRELVEIGSTDLQSASSVVSQVIQGEYPRYNDLMVERGKYVEILVDPEKLKKMAGFFQKFVDSFQSGLKVKVPVDGVSPIRFYAKRKDNQEATGLIMPIKSE